MQTGQLYGKLIMLFLRFWVFTRFKGTRVLKSTFCSYSSCLEDLRFDSERVDAFYVLYQVMTSSKVCCTLSEL